MQEDFQAKLFTLYGDFFTNLGMQLIMEKKKSKTSSKLVRQVNIRKEGFLQTNKKVIPFPKEFLFQTKTSFVTLPMRDQQEFPWSSDSNLNYRVYFCRQLNNITMSVTAKFRKPTAIYFTDDKSAQRFCSFLYIFQIKNPQLLKPLFLKLIKKTRKSFEGRFKNALRTMAEIKKKEFLGLNQQIRTFDQSRIESAFVKLFSVGSVMKVQKEKERFENENLRLKGERHSMTSLWQKMSVFQHKLQSSTNLNLFTATWRTLIYSKLLTDKLKKVEKSFIQNGLIKWKNATLIERLKQIQKIKIQGFVRIWNYKLKKKTLYKLVKVFENRKFEDYLDFWTGLMDIDEQHSIKQEEQINQSSKILDPQQSRLSQQQIIEQHSEPKVEVQEKLPDPPKQIIKQSHPPLMFTKFQLSVDSNCFLKNPSMHFKILKQSNHQLQLFINEAESNSLSETFPLEVSSGFVAKLKNKIFYRCSVNLQLSQYQPFDSIEISIYQDDQDQNQKLFSTSIKMKQIIRFVSDCKCFHTGLLVAKDFSEEYVLNDKPMISFDILRVQTFQFMGTQQQEKTHFPINDYEIYGPKFLDQLVPLEFKKQENQKELLLEYGAYCEGQSKANSLYSQEQFADILEQIVEMLPQEQIPDVGPSSQIFENKIISNDLERFGELIENFQEDGQKVVETIRDLCLKGLYDRQSLLLALLNFKFEQNRILNDIQTWARIYQYEKQMDLKIDDPFEILYSQSSKDTQFYFNLEATSPQVKNIVAAFRWYNLYIAKEVRVPFYKQLVILVQKLLALYDQNQVFIVLVCLSNLMPQKESNSNLNIDFLQCLTLYPKQLLPQDIQNKFFALSLNVEIFFLDDILSLFSHFFHWEAFLRVLDYITGLLWYERMNRQLGVWTIQYSGWLALVSLEMSIIDNNSLQLKEAKTIHEVQNILKLYGHLIVDIDLLIGKAYNYYQQIKHQCEDLQKRSQLMMVNKNHIFVELLQQSNLQHVRKFLQNQMPNVKFESDELDIPDEHENSYYRDMDLQDEISQLSSAKFIDKIEDEGVNPLIKPTISMIYLVIQNLNLHLSDFREHQIVIQYGKQLKSEKVENDLYYQLQFEDSWEISMNVLNADKNLVLSGTINLKNYAQNQILQDTVYLTSNERVLRHYIKSEIIFSVLLKEENTRYNNLTLNKLPFNFSFKTDCLQKLQSIDLSNYLNMNKQIKNVIDFDGVHFYAINNVIEWKSISQQTYESFKKTIKQIFNRDSSMIDLNSVFKSFTENSSFYLTDLLIEIIIAMQGSFKQKVYLLYDLLLLYQPSQMHDGIYFDTMNNLILSIYKNMRIQLPFYSTPGYESKFIKARLTEYKHEQEVDENEDLIISKDITDLLNETLNYYQMEFHSRELMFINNQDILFILQKIINFKIFESNKLQLKFLIGKDVKIRNLYFSSDFRVIRESIGQSRSVQHLLNQNLNFIPLSIKKIIGKDEFEQIFQQLPGMSLFFESSTQNHQNGYSTQFQIQLSFECYTLMELQLVDSNEDYIQMELQFYYNQVLDNFNDFLQKRGSDMSNQLMSDLNINIPNFHINFKTIKQIIELQLMTNIMDQKPNQSRFYMLNFAELDSSILIKNGNKVQQLQQTDYMTAFELLEYGKNYQSQIILNYQRKPIIRKEKLEVQQAAFQNTDLALQHGPNNAKMWKPVQLQYVVRNKKGEIKGIAVIFQDEPNTVIMVHQNELLTQYDLDYLETKEKV